MSKIKVNSIVNGGDTGPTELSKGATVPAGQRFTAEGDITIVGVVTASNFVGNGSGLTGLTFTTQGQAIGFKKY